MLAASRSHRDNVGCEIPVSSSSLLALTAFGPSIRRTIRAFTFAAYSIARFRSRPAQLMGHHIEAATTLTQGDPVAKNIQIRQSGGFNHYLPANYFASHAPNKLDADTVARFEKLFRTINNLF